VSITALISSHPPTPDAGRIKCGGMRRNEGGDGHERPGVSLPFAEWRILRIASVLRAAKWTLVLSNTVLAIPGGFAREAGVLRITQTDIDAYLDVLCALAEHACWPANGSPLLRPRR